MHDLGRLGVSNAIWDKPGPLTGSERRTRPACTRYLTDRMLAGSARSPPSREIAARHHERLDGSGYPRGLTAAVADPSDRLLAAADVYHAMTEPRPYRDRCTPDLAAARAARRSPRRPAGRRRGRRGADAPPGTAPPARRSWPAGLTAREVEVLGLLARGQSNKQIAAAAGHRAEDRGQPRRAHLRETGRRQPGRGDAVRDPARPCRQFRTTAVTLVAFARPTQQQSPSARGWVA